MAGRKRRKKDVAAHLTRAARALRTATAAEFSRLDIYPGQEAVLFALEAEEGISLADLAARLAVKPPTVTKTLARMSAQGLVEKRAAAGDGRQSRAYLTEAGNALLGEVRKAQTDIHRAALSGLSEKDCKQLRKLLKRVERNLSAEPQG